MTPELAKNIEKYRQKSGLSLEALAEKSFLSLSTLKGLLYRGENDPRVSTLINLANAMDCTVNDLIGYRKAKKAEESERILIDIMEMIEEHFRE